MEFHGQVSFNFPPFCQDRLVTNAWKPDVQYVYGRCFVHALSLSQGGAEDRVDFVLVEYIMALALHRRGIVKAIMPVILNEQDDGTHTDRCVAS